MPLKDQKFAQEQVMRMAGLKNGFRPLSVEENKAVFKELVRVLMLCRNADHATFVVDEIMHGGESCPQPGALRSLIHAHSARFGNDRKVGCDLCVDGWALVHLLIDMRGGFPQMGTEHRITRDEYRNLFGKINEKTQMVYEAVEKCACVGGVSRMAAAAPYSGKERSFADFT